MAKKSFKERAAARARSAAQKTKTAQGMALGGGGAYLAGGWVGDQIAQDITEEGITDPDTMPTLEIAGKEIPKYEAYSGGVILASAFAGIASPVARFALFGTGCGGLGAARGVAAFRHRLANPNE